MFVLVRSFRVSAPGTGHGLNLDSFRVDLSRSFRNSIKSELAPPHEVKQEVDEKNNTEDEKVDVILGNILGSVLE
jgi:hypothetical protein